MLPDRYQSRPVQPHNVEAILLSEDNLDEAVDWLKTLTPMRSRLRGQDAYIGSDPDTGARRILSPFYGGWYACYVGDYLVHVGGGEARSMSAEDFRITYEPAPAGDPALCSCLHPQAYGHAEGDGPMKWDHDCKTCGKRLTEESVRAAIEPLGHTLPSGWSSEVDA